MKKNDDFIRIFKLAKANIDNENFVCALVYLEKLLGCDPKDGDINYYYGQALHELGLLNEAKMMYENALKYVEKEYIYKVHLSLADVFKQIGDFEKADEYYKRGIEGIGDKQLSDKGGFVYLRAENLYKARKFKESELLLKDALKYEELYFDEVYYTLGCVYRAQRKYGEAKSAFEESLKHNPKSECSQKALADIKYVDEILETLKRVDL